jgi:hypothetical protein
MDPINWISSQKVVPNVNAGSQQIAVVSFYFSAGFNYRSARNNYRANFLNHSRLCYSDIELSDHAEIV